MNHKTLKVIETMDNPNTHRKNVCALASEVIVFIALILATLRVYDMVYA